MARLGGIQKALADWPSVSLVDLERKLQADHCCVLSQEEELWALMSRVNWMLLGDRNTSIYHISTLVRRKRNSMTTIMFSSGEWLHFEREVKEAIRFGFSELYTTSHSYTALNVLVGSSWQARLSDEEQDSIEGGVLDDEIKAGLWSFKAFKAPGLNGLHAGFFQQFWLVVGKSMVEEVRKIFATMEIPEELNRTHISLIPKIPRPETLNNYRPISLCNTVYKIVSKILVAWLRPLLGKLISPL